MSVIYSTGNLRNPKVVVVCDIPTVKAYAAGHAMSVACMDKFREEAERSGFVKDDFAFVIPAPPMSEHDATSEARTNAFLDGHRPLFMATLNGLLSKGPALLMYCGKHAGRQVMGKTIQITKKRGQIHNEEGFNIPVLPMLSPGNVLRRPEVAETFETDFRLAGAFKEAGWSLRGYSNSRLRGEYKWCLDLEEEIDLDNPPEAIALDVETKGLKWYDPSFRVLTIQLSWAHGQGIILPIDINYFNDDSLRGVSTIGMPKIGRRDRERMLKQVRRLLADKRVKVCGANLKFDLHALKNLDIEVACWQHDTVQLAFVCDDNMQQKALSECVRRWIPSMAGYSDNFDREIDKSMMDKVPHDKMLPYAAGDTDVARRLTLILVKLAKEDPQNYRCYTRIQMPALRQFFRIEREGLYTDQPDLLTLGNVIGEQIEEINNALLNTGRLNEDGTVLYAPVSAKVKRRQLELTENKLDPEDALSFTRADFIIDVLFSPKREGGRGHVPVVFTDTTAALDPSERDPSTSAKHHLIYFDEDPFVGDLTDLIRLRKLQSTYVGLPEGYEYRPVKLLKNGKFQKAAQDIITAKELNVTYQEAPGGEPEAEHMAFDVKENVAFVLDLHGRPLWRDYRPPSGFWQHLAPDSKIHPGFYLDRTVTGRSASKDPNGQNIPKRGRTPRLKILVSSYRKIFKARPGWILLEVDLSQAELRLVAWMARERTMLKVYKDGGDIHATTAANALKITMAQFNALSKDDRFMYRYHSKARNFGLCIAEGQSVLTQVGEIPIEKVKDWHLLWDGQEWIKHEGVIFKGYKKVITWDGVTATPDHKVWAEEGRMLSLREASSEVCPLARTATADGIPVRWNADFKTENFEKGRKLLGNKWKMQSLWKRMGVVLQQSIFRKNKKLSLSEAQEISTGRESGNSRAKIRFYDSALQTGYARIVSQLQRERDKSIVREQRGFHMVGIKEVPGDRFQGVGLRQGEQRWSLFQGESQASYSEGKSSEYTTKEEAGAVRVYDIINAGPRRRFTCQGRLVSNCYGMWWKSYRTYARTDYGIHISESQAKQEWDDFFELYSDLPRW